MNVEVMQRSPIGRVVPIRVYDRRFDQHFDHHAYVPDPLPRHLELAGRTWAAISDAAAAVGRLDGAASELPHPMLIVRPLIRREAVSTSALEGTYSPIDEVLGAEARHKVERPETLEVLNYVEAVEHGLELVEQRPVSVNLIRELHAILLKDVRGDSWQRGKVRQDQNWIGPDECKITDATFVPPPSTELVAGLSAWEKWIHRDDLPLVARAALGHYQFETLHPFVDGNGRLGRLVVLLQFIEEGLLRDHLMTISPYLEGQRDTYIEQLRSLTISGDFDPWIQFFAGVLTRAATESLQRIRDMQGIRDDSVQRIRSAGVKGVAVQIAEDLIGYPTLTVQGAADRYSVSYPSAKAAIDKLVEHGVLDHDESSYRRLYFARAMVGLLR